MSTLKPPRPPTARPPKGPSLTATSRVVASVEAPSRLPGPSVGCLAASALGSATWPLRRTFIGSVERCERNIALDNLALLAWALDVELSELLTTNDA